MEADNLSGNVEITSGESASSAAAAVETSNSADGKIVVNFVAVASAPQLKKRKFRVAASQNFVTLTAFLYKQLKSVMVTAAESTAPASRRQGSDAIFAYICNSFMPCPDESLQSLYDVFGADGVLTIHYCLTPAYG